MKKAATEFSHGLMFWALGWRYLITQPALLSLAMVPMFLAFAGAAVFMNFAWIYVPAGIQGLLSFLHLTGPGWFYDIVYYPLVIGAGLLFFVLGIYLIYVLTALIAIPFYSLLADRTLSRLNKKPGRLGWGVAFALLLKGLVKTAILLALGVVLFVFSFLPILNAVAAAGAMLLLAFDTMDYSFEVLGWGYRRRLKYLMREWAQWAGMATGIALTLLIPGLTLLVIPGAVVGGALIVKSENRSEN